MVSPRHPPVVPPELRVTRVPASLPTEGSRIAGVDANLARVPATSWLIACDDVAWADGVATALRARGATVHLLDSQGAGVQRLAMAEAEVLLLHKPPTPALRQALSGYPGVKWAKPLVVRPLRLWPLQTERPEVDTLLRDARVAWLPDRRVCSWARGSESRLHVDLASMGTVRLLRALATPPSGAFRVQLSTVDVIARVTLADGYIEGACYQLRASNAVCRDTPAALRHVLELGAADCEVTRLASRPSDGERIPLQDALHEAFEWLDAQRYGALADEPTLRADAPSAAPPGPSDLQTGERPRIPLRPETPWRAQASSPATPPPSSQRPLEVEILGAQVPPPSPPAAGSLPPPMQAAPAQVSLPAPSLDDLVVSTPYPPLPRARGGRRKRWVVRLGGSAAIACVTFGVLSLWEGWQIEEPTVTAGPSTFPGEGERSRVSSAPSEPTGGEVERVVEPLQNEPAAAPALNPFDAVYAQGAAATSVEGGPASRGQWARSRRLAREAREERQGERARALYEQALELDPDNPRALAGLAAVLLEAGELESARKLAERAVHVRTGRYAYRMLLGRVASEQGDWDAAAVAYDEALECRPNSRAAQQGLARAKNRGE